MFTELNPFLYISADCIRGRYFTTKCSCSKPQRHFLCKTPPPLIINDLYRFKRKKGSSLPYAWTHIVYGDELANKINYSPTHKLLFHFGCQGPDFYFFYRFWPWRKSKHGTILGDVFHTKECGPVLLELIKKAKASAVLQDYIAGFITHHILDRTTHAFIHYYAGYKKYKHQQLESILDTLIAEKLRGIQTWKTPLVPQIDVGKKLPEEVVDTLYETTTIFYPKESRSFPKKEYHQAYEDMKTFFYFHV